MKTLFKTFCISIFAVTVFAAPTEKQAIADWNSLEQAEKTLDSKMKNLVPSYVANIIEQNNDKAVSELSAFDKTDLPAIQKLLAKCTADYGDSPDKMNESIKSIVKTDKHPNTQFGQLYKKVNEWINNISQAKKNKAAALIKEAESVQGMMDSFAAQQSEQNLNKLKQFLETALKFDPENSAAKEMLKKADEKFKKAQTAINKKIDEAKWPGNYKNFAGPGSPESLAKSALEWLQNDENSRKNNKDHTFAVCVKGDWVIAKKNILGNPIQWGLPIYGACYNEKEKKEGVCRVFGLTIITAEGKNVRKAPPWTAVRVGDIFKMKINNIESGSSSKCGNFCAVFWLGLAFGNILAGLLAASTIVKQKIPKLKSFYEKITPFSNVIGVIVLAIGVLSLIGAVLQLFVLKFVILSNIIPQLSAIAIGLFLGKELLLKKPKLDKISELSDSDAAKKAEEVAENATAKAQDLLKKYEDKINLLEKYQEKIGVACVIIGVLHLFLSGLPLI